MVVSQLLNLNKLKKAEQRKTMTQYVKAIFIFSK